MRQDIGWFDQPENALGVLTSRLAVDVKLIRLCLGQGTGATVSSMTSLMVGLIVSLITAWQFALAFLATQLGRVYADLVDMGPRQGLVNAGGGRRPGDADDRQDAQNGKQARDGWTGVHATKLTPPPAVGQPSQKS